MKLQICKVVPNIIEDKKTGRNIATCWGSMEKREVLATELVRRYNAFEEGGIVDSLLVVSHNLAHTMGIDYAIKKLSVMEDTMAVGAAVILKGIQKQAEQAEAKAKAKPE